MATILEANRQILGEGKVIGYLSCRIDEDGKHLCMGYWLTEDEAIQDTFRAAANSMRQNFSVDEVRESDPTYAPLLAKLANA